MRNPLFANSTDHHHGYWRTDPDRFEYQSFDLALGDCADRRINQFYFVIQNCHTSDV